MTFTHGNSGNDHRARNFALIRLGFRKFVINNRSPTAKSSAKQWRLDSGIVRIMPEHSKRSTKEDDLKSLHYYINTIANKLYTDKKNNIKTVSPRTVVKWWNKDFKKTTLLGGQYTDTCKTCATLEKIITGFELSIRARRYLTNSNS
jgi:hypothetical protein